MDCDGERQGKVVWRGCDHSNGPNCPQSTVGGVESTGMTSESGGRQGWEGEGGRGNIEEAEVFADLPSRTSFT